MHGLTLARCLVPNLETVECESVWVVHSLKSSLLREVVVAFVASSLKGE